MLDELGRVRDLGHQARARRTHRYRIHRAISPARACRTNTPKSSIRTPPAPLPNSRQPGSWAKSRPSPQIGARPLPALDPGLADFALQTNSPPRTPRRPGSASGQRQRRTRSRPRRKPAPRNPRHGEGDFRGYRSVLMNLKTSATETLPLLRLDDWKARGLPSREETMANGTTTADFECGAIGFGRMRAWHWRTSPRYPRRRELSNPWTRMPTARSN